MEKEGVVFVCFLLQETDSSLNEALIGICCLEASVERKQYHYQESNMDISVQSPGAEFDLRKVLLICDIGCDISMLSQRWQD